MSVTTRKEHVCCAEKTGNWPSTIFQVNRIVLLEIRSDWRRRQRRTTRIFYLILDPTLGQARTVLLVAETTKWSLLLHLMAKSTSGLWQTDVVNEQSINHYSPLMEADTLLTCASILKIAHWFRAVHVRHWSKCGLRSDWLIKLTTIDEAASIDTWFSTD